MSTPANGGPLTIPMMIGSDIMGGAETVLLQLAGEIRARGHRVITISVVNPVAPLPNEGWLTQAFRDGGFEWRQYHQARALDWRCVRELVAMIRQTGAQVVHSHEFAMAVYGTAATRWARRPHVITMHGSQDMMDRLRRRLALRWALRRSAVTAAVSEDTQRYLLQRLRLPPAAIRLIRNGIPHRPGDARRIRQELRLAEGEPLILSVGNLIPRKGHIVLLRALASLGDDGTERAWRLAIAGGGPEREPLEEFSASHGLAGRVHLLGPRNDIPDLQAAASIFVMPSLWEGLPLAVLEAMFAGSAIIASKTSGIPEAITDGVDGVLLPPGDPAALAAALRTVLDSPGRRQELGAAARRRADAAFSIRIMADAYEAVYRALSVAW